MNALTHQSTRPELIPPAELSNRIGIAVQTLARWRSESRGPSYIKVGGRIVYKWSAVEAWLEANSQTAMLDTYR